MADQRLIVVSNRLPVSVQVKSGKVQAERTIGGLASALSSVTDRPDTAWIGWPGMQTSNANVRVKVEDHLLRHFGLLPVFIPSAQFEKFYTGFSNNCIWPLFHNFPRLAKYVPAEWDAYRAVNELYCQRVLEVAKPGDKIWVHDYQLMLLPALLRERLPGASVGFFLHIPFPSYEIFRELPWRNEVLRGLLGADLIGFHTYDYMRHFLSSLLRLLGLEHDLGQVTHHGRLLRADIFPLGVDSLALSEMAQRPPVVQKAKNLLKKFEGQKTVLSVDRLDFTKGINERLLAYELFLDKHPHWRERVRLVLICVPSRTSVASYRQLKRQVDELVGRINGKFGSPGWTPVWYLYRGFATEELLSFYLSADVAMVTPIRDGMNLVAKEYLASRVDNSGVLILGEAAGAASELGEALVVNPNDLDGMADALLAALTMPAAEQGRRNQPMRDRLLRYDSARWAADFLARLDEVKSAQTRRRRAKLEGKWRDDLVGQFRSSGRRLLLLDYDGTLVPIFRSPEQAVANDELKSLLSKLAADNRNTIVVISGRDHETLEEWVGGLGVWLVAEHGAWRSDAHGSNWQVLDVDANTDWKATIRPVLERYADRTPGSLVEEKTLALVWHYRMADPELGSLRAKELADTLEGFVANTSLHVLRGSKVLEVKQSGVGKGKAAARWLLTTPPPDFVLAAGDDETDEDMFDALPRNGWSVRVGHVIHSQANYYLNNSAEVRELLRELCEASAGSR